MLRTRVRWRGVRWLLLAVSALAIAAGASVAASGGSTIRGCVNKHSRVLTVPKGGKGCGHRSTPLRWNVTGPPGPQGPPGLQGNQGIQGAAGLSASASDSQSPASPTNLTTADQTLLSATIRTNAPSRIEASGGGTFQYTPSGMTAQGAELDCGLQIDGTAMGNRTQADFSGTVAYKEPGSAGGAAIEAVGTHVVTLRCKQAILAGSPGLAFVHGDLNVLAAAP